MLLPILAVKYKTRSLGLLTIWLLFLSSWLWAAVTCLLETFSSSYAAETVYSILVFYPTLLAGSQGYYVLPVQFSDLTLIWLIWGTLLPSGTCKPLKSLAVTLLFLGHIWMPRDELIAEASVSDPLAEAAAQCHTFPAGRRHSRARERSSRRRPPGCSGMPEFLQQQEVETWAPGPPGPEPREAPRGCRQRPPRPCPGRGFMPCKLPHLLLNCVDWASSLNIVSSVVNCKLGTWYVRDCVCTVMCLSPIAVFLWTWSILHTFHLYICPNLSVRSSVEVFLVVWVFYFSFFS